MIESLPQGLAEWVAAISQYGGFWIYIFVFIAGVTENIFPPFPGDSILFAGGVLASAGLVWWPLVLVCGVVGNVIGAMTVYWFGYSKGRHYFITHHGRLIDEARLHRIENWFERYGTWIIIGSRFLTGIRSGIALCAGLGEVPASQMLLYTTLSTLLWNSVIITLAFLLGSNWNEISEFAGLYNRLIIGMLVAIAAGWGIRQFALKRARQRTEP